MFNHYRSRANPFRHVALAALLAAGQAHAATPTVEADSFTIRVHVGDLDLRTSAGEAKMRHRVKVAAYQVCAPTASPASIDWDNLQSCVRDAVRDATPQMQTLLAEARGNSLVATALPSH